MNPTLENTIAVTYTREMPDWSHTVPERNPAAHRGPGVTVCPWEGSAANLNVRFSTRSLSSSTILTHYSL